MSTLYELSEQYADLQEMLYDTDMEEQVILDTLEAIDGEFEDKADNYAKLIKSMIADAELIKNEEQRLRARRASLENRVAKLKEVLQYNMEYIGKEKFKTALFSFSIAQNGGKLPLIISENLGDIPNKYLIPQPAVPDTNAIRELLEEKEVEWAHLGERGRSLRIR